MSSKDRDRFGLGYQTDVEVHNAFALADDRVRYDKNGAGGAVPVRGYKGIWPLFGPSSERLGGQDLVIVHDDGAKSNAPIGGAKSDPAKANDAQDRKMQAGSGDGTVKPGDEVGVHIVKRPKWMCRPKTSCSPCAKDELHRPYCQPYGNRVVIECRRIEVTKPPERKPLQSGQKTDTKGKGKAPSVAQVENARHDLKKANPGKEQQQQQEQKAAAANGKGQRRRKVGLSQKGKTRKTRSPEEVTIRYDEDLVQLGEIFLETRNDHLWPRQEMFVGGHVYKGYQICGRDRSKEAWDYAEFVAMNLLLALVGIYVLLRRQRFLSRQHQSMLARRIGQR